MQSIWQRIRREFVKAAIRGAFPCRAATQRTGLGVKYAEYIQSVRD